MVFKVDDNKCFFSTKSAYYNYDTEGSCDTEYWSNDAEKCLCHHRNTILKYIKTENSIFQL